MADDVMPWFLVGLLSGVIGGGLVGALIAWAIWGNPQVPVASAAATNQVVVQRDALGRIVAIGGM